MESLFVRCLKPNSFKEPSKFDPQLILTQLRYSGMVEAVKIRKLGFPIRISYKEFIQRFVFYFSILSKVFTLFFEDTN